MISGKDCALYAPIVLILSVNYNTDVVLKVRLEYRASMDNFFESMHHSGVLDSASSTNYYPHWIHSLKNQTVVRSYPQTERLLTFKKAMNLDTSEQFNVYGKFR